MYAATPLSVNRLPNIGPCGGQGLRKLYVSIKIFKWELESPVAKNKHFFSKNLFFYNDQAQEGNQGTSVR